MIKLYTFGPSFGLPDASPFVMKVETYLRLTGQTFETAIGDVRKAPRGQLPYADVDGRVISDSTAIVDAMESKRAEKMDAHLTPAQAAVGQAFKSMMEEHLYFGVLYLRWMADDGWVVFEPALREMLGRAGVPSLFRGFVCKSARKHVTARVERQGMGRAPREEVVGACTRIVDALAEQIGEGPYFFGAAPSTIDATAYPFVAGALCAAFDNEVRRHAATKKNLVAYADRVKDQYWKD